MADFDMSMFQTAGSSGIDALFENEPKLVTPTSRVRVASIRDLAPFMRISSDTLVHKSQQELWSLTKEADGSYFISRLFDDNGEPLKG